MISPRSTTLDHFSGKVVMVSSSAWSCLVIHKAPLNPSCEKDANPSTTCMAHIVEEPAGWKAADYDASAWPNATEYTEAAVGVKEGYFDITWSDGAKLIWTSDLKQDNTLLCKVEVGAP